MIDALFGFQGRLARLAFLGWNLAGMALVAVMAVAFLVLGAGLSGLLSGLHGAPAILGAITGLSCGVAGIWTTLALTTKRIRDVGLAPWPLIIGATAILMVDYYSLTRLTEVRFFAPFAKYTPLGGLFAVAWIAFLICWPSASEPVPDAPRNRDPEPVPGSGSERAQFGRRR
jgi:uncharacterized membrane protein YhaH (DUF805 family)